MTNASPPIVLIVDDEAPIRNMLAHWLQADGYRCVQAADAKAAWQQLQEYEVRVVILDVRMPGHSGVELLHEIAEHHFATAVIMLTSVNEPQTMADAIERGAVSYLIKPPDRERLLHAVRGALSRQLLSAQVAEA
ncbi:MAG: response regulator [Thermoguttaceae bacterium]